MSVLLNGCLAETSRVRVRENLSRLGKPLVVGSVSSFNTMDSRSYPVTYRYW